MHLQLTLKLTQPWLPSLPGYSQPYNASASDIYGNNWDITNLTDWSINPAAGGLWINNQYTSANSGSWSITGAYAGLSSNAYLTVNHASAFKVQVSPKNAVMTAGSTESFTATASDRYGNVWDVSGNGTWDITILPGGFWGGNTYCASQAGNWIVTVTANGLSDTANLTVNQGPALSISLNPTSATITAGSSQLFTATAFDSNGNRWDVTDSTYWTIDSNAGGSWSGNTYLSNSAGTWIITGTFSGITATASLTVIHGSVAGVSIQQTSDSITAGSSETYTANAFDAYGNTWSVTASTAWSIDSAAEGSWQSNIYNSCDAGVWNVTGTLDGLSTSTYLAVNHGAAVNLAVNPYDVDMSAGSSEPFSALASDVFGNTWDVTDLTAWDSVPAEAGFWVGNAYTATLAGPCMVMASFGNFKATSAVDISHSSVYSLAISPRNPLQQSGNSQLFYAAATDAYGNSWDITSSIVWTIDSNPGGSWSGNSYTPAKNRNVDNHRKHRWISR